MTVELLSANHGAAHAATMAARANRSGRGFCSGVYPITPSTECGELYQQSYAQGELNVWGNSKIASFSGWLRKAAGLLKTLAPSRSA